MACAGLSVIPRGREEPVARHWGAAQADRIGRHEEQRMRDRPECPIQPWRLAGGAGGSGHKCVAGDSHSRRGTEAPTVANELDAL